MLFRNAIRLLAENFKNVYKIALYKVVISLITIALCTAILLPQLMGILNSMPMQEFLTDVKDFFGAFFSVNAEKLQLAQESMLGEDGTIQTLLRLISSKSTPIILSCVGCVIVYFIQKFFDAIGVFAVGGSLNDKMSAYADTGFFTCYVRNFGRACKYAILYALVAFAFELLSVGLVVLFLSITSVIVAVFLSITVIVLLQAVKMTWVGNWLPAMIVEKDALADSMREVNKEKHFIAKMFSTYWIACYFVVLLNVSAMVFSFGSALIITLPASFTLFICIQFVHYYTVRGKKYFISFDRIATNPDKGDREHIFSYIDVTKLGQPQVQTDGLEQDNKDGLSDQQK